MPRLIHIGMQIISAWLYKYAYKIMPHMWKNVKTCIIMSKNIIGKIRIMDNEKLLINIKEAGKRAAKILLIFVFCLFYRCPFKLFLHIECPGYDQSCYFCIKTELQAGISISSSISDCAAWRFVLCVQITV